ncbi:MAG: Fic family protein [Roseovarius sp.]|nr:Fic family protein [Roseovarius sp.]
MAKKPPEKALKELLDIIAAHPNGTAASDIAKNVTNKMPHRTLQYRLKHLVDSDQLQMDGSGRAAKYRLADAKTPNSSPAVDKDTDHGRLINLSESAQAIRDYVGRDAMMRQPVGYNQDFLERYQPNQTFYLNEDELEQLEKLGRPKIATQPAGTYAKLIFNRLLIDLAWNSSRLEGNTYSLLDTKRLIEFGKEAANGNHVETQMILNHKDAIKFLVEAIDHIDFNAHTFRNLHALLSNNLLADPTAPGRLRYMAVGIEKSVFHPLEVPQRIEEFFNLLLSKVAEIQNPFEQAFFLMAHIPYLQPFDDVNKRVSRLAANIPLIRGNLAPLSFIEVPKRLYTDAILGVYELRETALLKDVFIWAYERSAAQYVAVRQSLGEPDPFRLKYHAELRDIIAATIRAKINRRQIVDNVSRLSAGLIKAEDQSAFVEILEEELLSLNSGNFARYQVSPSEFEAWQTEWNKS